MNKKEKRDQKRILRDFESDSYPPQIPVISWQSWKVSVRRMEAILNKRELGLSNLREKKEN